MSETKKALERLSSVINTEHKFIVALVDAVKEDTRAKTEQHWRTVVGGPIAEAAVERQRQKEVEGWTTEHDDKYTDCQLARAAACYAATNCTPRFWPWTLDFWKPTTHRRNCIKAIALLIAEVERLDRKEKQS